MDSNFIAMEKEYLIDYNRVKTNKSAEKKGHCTQKTQDIDDIRKSHKRCGEVYMNGTEDFKFVCLLCEKMFYTNVEEFINHVVHCQLKVEACFLERDPIELENDSIIKGSTFYIDVAQNSESIEKMEYSFLTNSEEESSYTEKSNDEGQINFGPIRKFSCHFCQKRYTWRRSLDHHLRTKHLQDDEDQKSDEKNENSKNSLHSCDHCDKKYSSEESLKRHLKNVEIQLNYISCEFPGCRKKFKTQDFLQLHKDHDHKEYVLDYSEERTVQELKSSEKMEYDFLINSEEDTERSNETRTNCKPTRIFICHYCKKEYAWRRSLDHHLKTKHLNKEQKSDDEKAEKSENNSKDTLYPCDHCDKKYLCKESLERHLKNVEILLNYIFCDFPDCRKKFKTEKYLQLHKDHDHKECVPMKPNNCNNYCENDSYTIDPLMCRYCHKRFNKTDRKINHEYKCVRTGLIMKPYKCELCGKSFQTVRNKKRHELVHKGNKPHKCHICHVTFTDKSNLLSHIQRHLGNKKSQCRFCEKTFYSNSERNSHEKVHTGEKRHQCAECGKLFSVPSKLNWHIKKHSVVKPFKCEQCGKCFLFRYQLRDHKVTHTNEKPYSCKTCSTKFSKRSVLKQHMKIHSDAKYVCKICDKRFKQGPGLYSHMKTHSVV